MFSKKIIDLQKLLHHFSVDAYLVPGTDPHKNEYEDPISLLGYPG